MKQDGSFLPFRNKKTGPRAFLTHSFLYRPSILAFLKGPDLRKRPRRRRRDGAAARRLRSATLLVPPRSNHAKTAGVLQKAPEIPAEQSPGLPFSPVKWELISGKMSLLGWKHQILHHKNILAGK